MSFGLIELSLVFGAALGLGIWRERGATWGKAE
jgi:hypothetical protein